MSQELDEIIREFLIESFDSLDQLDQDMVTLEQQPTDTELISRIFRNLHTIKGACGYLGFEKLERVSHAGENLLGRLRDGSMSVDGDIIDTLLSVNDAIRLLLTESEKTGEEGEFDPSAIVTRIQAQLQSEGTAPAAAEGASSPSASSGDPAAPPKAKVPKKKAARPTDSGSSIVNSSIRVDVRLLDELMNLVGELVLARNQLLQHTNHIEDSAIHSTGQRLSHITTELQARIMKTRMQPIGNAWHKLPRLVRDTAALCDKQVELSMSGQDTELDRTILEAIRDPLTHIVRNAIDHGIETPTERNASAKSPAGQLQLRAYHEGGQVNIVIADDGGGINLEKVRVRARERGLVSAETLNRMNDHDVTQLIFHPGFSTAEKITNVSGRGVGMDVVRTNIEKIGGQVEVETRSGKGTSVKIRIPLTLAIIPALIITCHAQRFALPQVSLDELVRLEGDAARRSIEHIHGVPVYRLRGQLLPIVYLRKTLTRPPVPKPENPDDEELNIVVLRCGDLRYGLVVDAILDTEEIVVKPLSSTLKGLEVYAGATIMGDGRVALILDAPGLASFAGLSTRTTSQMLARTNNQKSSAEKAQTLLLLRVGERRLAMRLSAVSRLEEFPQNRLERVGQEQVVQYRGGILPLISLADVLGEHEPVNRDEPLRVVVRSVDKGAIGLIVGEVVDIVTEVFKIHPVEDDDLLQGYAIVQSHITEVLDVEEVLRRIPVRLVGTAA
ncbi:MAG: chemotaxis protein CheW [Myxococcota bacterium]